MKPADLLALAVANYLRSKLRSSLTTLGVTIGTALVVVLIALASGAERNVRDQILSIGDLRSVTVQPAAPGSGGFTFTPKTITDDTVERFRAIEGVRAVYRTFDTPVGVLLEGGDDAVVRPIGIDPGAPVDRGLLVAGRHLEPTDRGAVVLPSNLARVAAGDPVGAVGREITLRLGGTVRFGGRTFFGSGLPQELRLRVVGVFDESASSTQARIHVDDALEAGARNRATTVDVLRTTVGYSGVTIEAADADDVGAIAQAVQGLGYSSFSLKQIVEQIDQGFGIFKGILGGIGGVALLVAALGIGNTMVMAVLERTREIGIMKAVGASPRDIRRLFLGEAVMVGVVGGVLGVLLGVAAGKLIEFVVRFLNPPRAGQTPPEIFTVSPLLVLGAFALAVAVALAAGWLPSRRAMRMSPVQALRYE
jgi:putative ABC transport system permease protein